MSFHDELTMLKGFSIDLDGLLLDTESIYKKAWCTAANNLGIDLDTTLIDEAHGLSGEAWEKRLKGTVIPMASWTRFTGNAVDEWKKHLSQGVAILPGANEMLKFMRSEKIPHMIATNSPRRYAMKNIEASGLNIGGTGMICREDVMNAKPDPEIIKCVAYGLNMNVRYLGVLEDSETGVQAAFQSGAYAVYVQKRQHEKVKKMANRAFEDLHQCLNEMSVMHEPR